MKELRRLWGFQVFDQAVARGIVPRRSHHSPRSWISVYHLIVPMWSPIFLGYCICCCQQGCRQQSAVALPAIPMRRPGREPGTHTLIPQKYHKHCPKEENRGKNLKQNIKQWAVELHWIAIVYWSTVASTLITHNRSYIPRRKKHKTKSKPIDLQ